MADSQASKSEEESSWIPATQRPDGTWRKARRVKEGYVPQDEVEKYESRGKQWVNSIPKLPPGMAEETATAKSKNQKKNERRKQKRKEEASGSSSVKSVEAVTEKVADLKVGASKHFTTVYSSNPNELKQKKLKNLKKKLRQIEELQAKIDSGEMSNPEATQLEKLSRREEIENEIGELESS